jgi:hypothetical protein
MRAYIPFPISCAVLLILSACANVHQNAGTPASGKSTVIIQHGSGLPVAIVTPTSIQGQWQNTCTQDLKTRGYYTAVLNIQNSVMTVDTTSYADTACAYPIVDENRISNIVISPAGAVTALTETLVALSYVPHNAVMANLFNQNTFCGLNTWAAGQVGTVTDSTQCSGVAKSAEYHTELYGTAELYLDDCIMAGQTNCATVRYTKVTP